MKSLKSKISSVIQDPMVVPRRFCCEVLGPMMPDKPYLKMKARFCFNYKFDLDHPVTFNEKLNWLKLYAHKPEYTMMADKYEVKKYVAEKIGAEYVVPCLGLWDRADDIDFDSLPNKFVLKCTHNSGKAGDSFICRDKTKIDLEELRKKIAKPLRQNYFLPGRDKQYRDIRRRIIAETLLDDGTGSELRDYKWWCFDGKPVYMYYTNKSTNVYENFFDMDYNAVNINHGLPRLLPDAPKVPEFELMRKLAATLSKGIPFVRIDFFDVYGHVYFGEFTFFDWGGMRPFSNYETDLMLGKLITLPTIK